MITGLKRSAIQTLLAVIVLAVLAVLAVFVWPSRYKYDHMKLGGSDFPVRIERLTGKTEILRNSGWERSPGESLAFPNGEVAKLVDKESMTLSGEIKVEVYNGSSWQLSEITVLVTVLDDDQKNQILSRTYRLTPEWEISPQRDGKFHAFLGVEMIQGQSFTFKITGAKGRPE